MASVNKVIILGNVGQDPEPRYQPSGSAIVNLRVATSRNWKDKQTGEKREATEWHTIVFFDRLAEIAAEYLRKGSPVYVEGRLQTRKWTDKEGKERWSTEVIATEMQLLGSRGDRAAGGAPGGEFRGEPARPAAAAAAAAGQGGRGEAGDFEDDIPF
jgi:single-strand DNA-binding protein